MGKQRNSSNRGHKQPSKLACSLAEQALVRVEKVLPADAALERNALVGFLSAMDGAGLSLAEAGASLGANVSHAQGEKGHAKTVRAVALELSRRFPGTSAFVYAAALRDLFCVPGQVAAGRR